MRCWCVPVFVCVCLWIENLTKESHLCVHFFLLTSLLWQSGLRAMQTPLCVAFIFKHNNSPCVATTEQRYMGWLQLNVAQSSRLFHVKGLSKAHLCADWSLAEMVHQKSLLCKVVCLSLCFVLIYRTFGNDLREGPDGGRDTKAGRAQWTWNVVPITAFIMRLSSPV